MTPSERDRVLVVDDEPDLCRLLRMHLERAGFAVETTASGGAALERVGELRPLVIVLDLMLPDLPGIEVCRRVRADGELAETGILMLTARGEEYDRVLGFELGADDYVPKPFNVKEVVLRVQALARRYRERRHARRASGEEERVRWRELELHPQQQRVQLAGRELLLQPIPFKLLALFLSEPGRVFSREEILDAVWGESAFVTDRAVDQHIRRLRKDLGDYGDAIETVYGFGYRIKEP